MLYYSPAGCAHATKPIRTTPRGPLPGAQGARTLKLHPDDEYRRGNTTGMRNRLSPPTGSSLHQFHRSVTEEHFTSTLPPTGKGVAQVAHYHCAAIMWIRRTR